MPLGPAKCRLCGHEHWNREPHVYGKAPKNDPNSDGEAPDNDPGSDGQSPGIDPKIVENERAIDGESTAGNRRRRPRKRR